MPTRKLLYGIIMTGAILLTGCSNDDSTPAATPIAIAFDVAQTDDGTDATRATNGYTGNITEENHQLRYTGFGVFATVEAGTAPGLMYNQQVEYVFPAFGSGLSGYWTYSPLKYWPNKNDGENQTVCFYAYAPYVATPSGRDGDGNPIVVANSGDTTPDHTATGIIGMSSNSSATPYILYSRALHPEENVDLLWASYSPKKIAPVRFTVTKDASNNIIADNALRHALARVRVRLAVTDGLSLASTKKLLVKSVTFTGKIAKTGKLDLTSTATTPTWYDQVTEETTIVTDHDPETNTDSYGIIAEAVRYIDNLPYQWQPNGIPHVDYNDTNATTKADTSTSLLCMGDAETFLYLIPQSSLSLSCVLQYCIMDSSADPVTTTTPGKIITIAPLNGNTTYDITLKITLAPAP